MSLRAWFDDRLHGKRLTLQGPQALLQACQPSEVAEVLAEVERQRRQGRWIALVLDYELGSWLEPALSPVAGGLPRLQALVFEQAVCHAWQAEDTPSPVLSARALMGRSHYRAAIHAIKARIAAGDFYQVNYTLPLEVVVNEPAEAAYNRLVARQSAEHAAFVSVPGCAWLSLSPELFVRREGTRLITRPMKGTAPRDADPIRDAELGRSLQASIKDRAENLMIVDLLRNDLGRLARPGSVRVDDLFALEPYPQVWQMTSTISAEVGDCSLADVLAALFPCGSVTGAPKIAAMQHIRAYEIEDRGIYCGSIGWLAPGGDLSLNVAIRTLTLRDGRPGRYGIGSGIVADSEADAEWDECLWKARSLGVTVDWSD
jgi:para-aminobenzoate synthetase component 1